MKVAAIQMTSGPEVDANLAQAALWIAEAASRGAQVAVLPENFAFMGLRDADKRAVAEAEGSGPIQNFLREAARRHAIWIVGGTVPMRAEGDGRVGSAVLVYDAEGQCVARYDKIHLFDVEVPGRRNETYRESAHVRPGNTPMVVDTPAGRLGLSVCYDIRFPELFRTLSVKGAQWIAIPSAFTVPTGQAHWEPLLRARAIENQSFVVAAAQSGIHAGGRRTYGDSMIVDHWGRILARLPRGQGCVVAELDPKAQAEARRSFPALSHRVL